MLILKATHRASVRAIVAVHVGNGTVEAEAACAAIIRTAPIDAIGPNIAERTTADESGARHGQFKRRGKSPCTIITAPT